MTQKKLIGVARHSALFRSLGDQQLGRVLKHFKAHHLQKGDFLFRADQHSRMMYFVVDGKLRVEKVTGSNQPVRIASLLAGDIVGEVAMLTGERHSGQVRAVTDAHLAGITKKDLAPLLRQYPLLLHNLTRIEAMRLRHNIVREQRLNRELGFIVHLYSCSPPDHLAAEPNTSAAVAAEKLKSFVMLRHDFLKKNGHSTDALRTAVSRTLMRYPSAYLPVNLPAVDSSIVSALISMADRLIVTCSEDEASVKLAQQVLLHADQRGKLSQLRPLLATVHHASPDNITTAEIERRLGQTVRFRLKLKKDFWQTNDMQSLRVQCMALGRAICDNSLGIAFGGGGARALSEIGIISELERHRIKFDHVAGTSMGSLIAALYAQGLTAGEMSAKFKEFLPNDRGLLRYNLPFVSFFRDRSVNRVLRRVFGKARIEDQPLPLTIIAADLISGQEIRLTRGLIWRAVRASMSLPVVFAPVSYHGHYLVDGGAINNVPGNVLREQGVERVLGINCTPLEDNTIREYLIETNLFQLLKPGDKFWNNFKRFYKALRLFVTRPPILQIANRAMMLEGSELIRQKSREFDLLFSPDVSRFGMFEFDRREEIIDAGRLYARSHAADLKRIFRHGSTGAP